MADPTTRFGQIQLSLTAKGDDGESNIAPPVLPGCNASSVGRRADWLRSAALQTVPSRDGQGEASASRAGPERPDDRSVDARQGLDAAVYRRHAGRQFRI